jgi:hypothetical protein
MIDIIAIAASSVLDDDDVFPTKRKNANKIIHG